VTETGWGEFEMSIKLHYSSESLEKPQQLWHHLRLHPYGTDEQKQKQVEAGEVTSWVYEEQLFNEPYEHFFDILTGRGSEKAKNKGAHGKAQSLSATERSAVIPTRQMPDQPYARDTEQLELQRLKEARSKVDAMTKKVLADLKEKENTLASLKAG
jgi:YEATS domain-containing protein 4